MRGKKTVPGKDSPQLNNKCYKTADDKAAARIVSRPVKVSQKHWETIFGTEDERKRRLKEYRQRRSQEIDGNKLGESQGPVISRWDPEWTVLSTGKRMSKGELKRYCKQHGKVWENG